MQLPGNTSLGSISLTTTDALRLEMFYRDGLGMHVLDREPGSLAFGVDGERPILKLITDPAARPAPARSAGLYHFALLLPGREALAGMLGRLIERGIPLEGAADHLVSEALYLSDPEGNGIEIYADRAQEGWMSADGKVKMGTLPLDVDGLLALADTPLGCIPAGTRLGHVHLQVTDLEAAVEFYTGIIGLDLIMRYGPSAAFLSAGGYHHHIGLNTWQGEGAPPPPPGSVGLREFSIIIRDADAWSELTQRLSGGEPDDPNRLSVLDPSGHAIDLIHA